MPSRETRKRRKSRKAAMAVGICLIVLGLLVLWWVTFVSRPHAVPVMLGAIAIVGGILTLKGFWGEATPKRAATLHHNPRRLRSGGKSTVKRKRRPKS